MTTQQNQLSAPPGWEGSLPEYLVYRSLTESFNKTEGVDFTYQSSLLGGRLSILRKDVGSSIRSDEPFETNSP